MFSLYKKKFIYIIIAVTIFLAGCSIYKSKAETSRGNYIEPSYLIEENRFILEMTNIHIDIKYPQVSTYTSSSSQDDSEGDINKQININKLLIPSELQSFNYMISDGLIKISNTGEFVYDSSPHTYELGMNCSYTTGFMNHNFLNLYKRSISYTRNGCWNYEAILIDMISGTQIMPSDFFDVDKFYEYLVNGSFKANDKDFDITSFFQNINKEQLLQYLSQAFVNQDEQIEVIVVYGEGTETIIYADTSKVIDMIKPEYSDYFKH